MPGRSRPFIVALALLLAGAATPPHAYSQTPDTTKTCGWDPEDLDNAGLPRTVSAILAHHPTNRVPPEAASATRRWFHECDVGSARRALLLLRNASETSPRDPALNAILAIAIARGPDVQIVGGRGYLYRAGDRFSNSEREARTTIAAAAKASPADAPALVHEMAALALAVRSKAALEDAQAMIGEHAKATNDGPSWAALADVAIAQGEYASATDAAARAVARGVSPARRAHAVALMRTEGQTAKGAREYMAALDSADISNIARFHEDIRFLLLADEAADWNATPAVKRAAWLRSAWEWRAATASLSLDERLVVHFQRLDYAFAHLTRTAFRGARPDFGFWLGADVAVMPIDDRGVTYVRHGAPDEIEIAIGGPPEVTWFYERLDGGRAILQFTKEGWGDYLLADPTSGCGSSHPETRIAPLQESYNSHILMWKIRHGQGAHQLIDPPACNRYVFTAAGDYGMNKYVSGGELRNMIKHSVLQAETATPRMTKPLNALVNTYAFQMPDDTGRTEVMTFVAVDAKDITRSARTDSAAYAMRFFAAAEDPAKRTATRADSAINMAMDAPFGSGDVMLATMQLFTAPAAKANLRVGVRNEADSLQGQFLTVPRAIPAFARNGFAMSDIVIATDGPGAWMRGDVMLSPIPAHRLTAGQPFRLFYELYGAAPNGGVTTTITVSPDAATGTLAKIRELISKRNGMSLQFDDRVGVDGDGVARVLRDVRADLEPGSYVMQVTVADANGRRTTMSTALSVYKD